MKRILFLTQGDAQVSSSRHRVYQYLPVLKKAGYETVVHPAVRQEEFQEAFMTRSWWGNFRRAFYTLSRRMSDLHQLRDFDYVFVQKPILPPPLFNMELRIARETRMIFDFDDAIFLKKPGGAFLTNLWAPSQRIALICQSAHKVIVGNHYLADFVRKTKVEPIVLPMAIDTEAFAASSKVVKHTKKIPLIGWVGSPSTQSDLKHVIPSLIDLHSKTPFVVRAIGATPFSIPVRFPIEWKSWSLKTEIQDIAQLDYGLAPLEDTPRNRGKCGLKILQYWAAGIPVIASPVGVYKEMIHDWENGMLASTAAEWTEKLLAMIKNPNLRHKIIEGGRKTVCETYSLKALTPQFLSLFE